jgi:tetratricopeptide (TPR) repeat protein
METLYTQLENLKSKLEEEKTGNKETNEDQLLQSVSSTLSTLREHLETNDKNCKESDKNQSVLLLNTKKPSDDTFLNTKSPSPPPSSRFEQTDLKLISQEKLFDCNSEKPMKGSYNFENNNDSKEDVYESYYSPVKPHSPPIIHALASQMIQMIPVATAVTAEPFTVDFGIQHINDEMPEPAERLQLRDSNRRHEEQKTVEYDDNLREIADSLHRLGLALLQLKKYSDALVKFEDALKIYRSIYPANNVAIATCLNSTGQVLVFQSRREDALNMFEEALDITIALFGYQSLPVASTLENISSVNFSLGRYDVAVRAHEEATRIKRAVNDYPNSEKIGIRQGLTMNNCGGGSCCRLS